MYENIFSIIQSFSSRQAAEKAIVGEQSKSS